jgi:RNA polymerase sigma-70 factor (ECF subfamily)
MSTCFDSISPMGLNSDRKFESMVGMASKRAYSLAIELTSNRSEAEDLLQDATIKAWKGFHTFDGQRSFLNWFLRIVQHAYLDRRRRENPIRNAESLTVHTGGANGESSEISIISSDQGPHQVVIGRMMEKAIRDALNDIPEVYRRAIESCDLEGHSYSEIAELTNTTVGTVRSRIHRGRKLLRSSLRAKGLMSLLESA